jgi:hypothetical protein
MTKLAEVNIAKTKRWDVAAIIIIGSSEQQQQQPAGQVYATLCCVEFEACEVRRFCADFRTALPARATLDKPSTDAIRVGACRASGGQQTTGRG